MSKNPAKDFGPIADDYAFFVDHATEAEQDLEAHRAALATLPLGDTVRWLDVGCAEGNFTARLLRLLDWPAKKLRLALVEPVEGRRREALAQLAAFTAASLADWPTLPDASLGPFDVILANHVFYYVPDLPQTVARLAGALAPQGMLRAAIAGRDNVLIQIWIAGFALLGRDIPYYTSEDVQAALDESGIPYAKQAVPYRIAFPDSEANRLRLIRFLLANHLTELPLEPLLELFDPYVRAGQIEIETASDHFTVQGR